MISEKTIGNRSHKAEELGSVNLVKYFMTSKNPYIKSIREHVDKKMDFFSIFALMFELFNVFNNIR